MAENCGCPEGYEYNEKSGLCEQIVESPAIWSGQLLDVEEGDRFSSYGKFGLRLYNDISASTWPLYGVGPCSQGSSSPYNVNEDNGSGALVTPYKSSVKSTLWGSDTFPCVTGNSFGRLNTVGIWAPGYPDIVTVIEDWDIANPSNLFGDLTPEQQATLLEQTELGFDFCVDITEEKQYMIGIAGDNKVKLYIDGVLAVFLDACTSSETTPFNYWHVFPVTLTAGQHIIRLVGININNQASFGGEIYDIDFTTFDSLLTTPQSMVDCGNQPIDLEPYILFSTEQALAGEVVDPAWPGEWTCPDGSTLDTCGTGATCLVTETASPLSCCYLIEPCDESVPPFQIELDTTALTELIVGNVYKFADPTQTLDNGGCYKVLDELVCDTPAYTSVTVTNDYESADCEICIPCYEITDCENPENTVIIKWDPDADPLNNRKSYVFDFAPDTCWSAELQFSPCQGTLYDASNITATYVDCDECTKSCYKLIDCEELYPTISTDLSQFQVYVGKVIYWQDQLGETHCATVEAYECNDEVIPVEPIIVLDCFDTCEKCLPQPVPEPIFELSSRSVRPGYDTPGCPPEYHEKVNCKFSEAVYQEMIAKRFGLKSCCDIDSEKYEIKKELLNLAMIFDPYLCNPICADYTYAVTLNIGDSAITTYIDCEGVEQTLVRDVEPAVIEYEVEICALTTVTPVIVITRADSSIEQYKLETSYEQCCCQIEVEVGEQICNAPVYTQELIVTYDTVTSGTMTINNQIFDITESPQTVVLEDLLADMLPVDLTIIFSDSGECNRVISDAFVAPMCEPFDVFQYRLIYEGGTPTSLLEYTDEGGEVSQTVDLNKIDQTILICAIYGSIRINGQQYYAPNEPCPGPGPCPSPSFPDISLIGICL